MDVAARVMFADAVKLMQRCDVLLDLGAGIRPQRLIECKRHICVEPHAEYADVLEANGYEVIRADALTALVEVKAVDTVVCLDMIEHVEKDEGRAIIQGATMLAHQQVIVFTPLGYMPQDGGEDCDAWGMQGQHWQKHRSGWTPEDFPGWRCVSSDRAFFAIWSAP